MPDPSFESGVALQREYLDISNPITAYSSIELQDARRQRADEYAELSKWCLS